MRRIKLTQGQFAIIDNEDFEKVSMYKWHFSDYGRTGYAKRRNPDLKPALIRMHHMILPMKKGFMIDHINGNGLDNRKSNLRLVTKSQNMMNGGKRKGNTSGYKGVCLNKNVKRESWLVHIWKDMKQIYIGSFKTKEDAAKAYNEAAKLYHGEYANLNKI